MRVDAPSSEKPFAYATLLPPPPYGQREHVGGAAELLDDLERRRLLALDPVRVERVDEHQHAALGQLEADFSASSKLPLTSATFAATARDCADLAAAIAPCGVSTTAVRPARAP